MRPPIRFRRRRECTITTYLVSDRLHDGRTVSVSVDGIAGTVSTWLAELDTCSSLTHELVRALRNDDWVAAYAAADALSIDVTVAA